MRLVKDCVVGGWWLVAGGWWLVVKRMFETKSYRNADPRYQNIRVPIKEGSV